MTDCLNCWYPNPSSVGLVTCRNCGTRLPEEPNDIGTAQPHVGQVANQLERSIRWLGYRRLQVVRFGAWAITPVALAISALMWTNPCLGLQDIFWWSWLTTGLLAFVTLIMLATMTPDRTERRTAKAVLIPGTGLNVLWVMHLMNEALTFSSLGC